MDDLSKFERCKYSDCDLKEQTLLCNNQDVSDFSTTASCENCEHFDSRYIEYPIQVNEIDVKDFYQSFYRKKDIGKLAKIRYCVDNKDYIGVYLGMLPCTPIVQYNSKEEKLIVTTINNAALYVPELKKIVFGNESFWSIISDDEQNQYVSDEEIKRFFTIINKAFE